MKVQRMLTGFVACVCLSSAQTSRRNAVIDWNAIAIQTISAAVPARVGPVGFLDIATVQAAVYDAVEAIDGRYKPYHFEMPGAGGSTAAAAAKAAHDVLVNRFPDQTNSLDTAYDSYFANNGISESDPGVLVGELAAASIIAFRANDGSFPNPGPLPFYGGTNPGEWRPTKSYLPGPPPSFAPMELPWVADVTPFTMTSPSQFRAVPPPSLTSEVYTRSYDEVKAFGSHSSSVRTPEQTDLAYFWAANYLIVWHKALRDIASAHAPDIGKSARLFALADFAMADAGITAWDTKRHYVFWRPITAIQEGDTDGNPSTDPDPNWQPLINTPNYPDYTSGANNLTGAVTRMLRLFFQRDRMSFSVTTNNTLAIQQTRMYERFSDAANDVVSGRVYEGIHFRFTDITARMQGRSVAEWTFKHFLRPLHDGHGGDGDD